MDSVKWEDSKGRVRWQPKASVGTIFFLRWESDYSIWWLTDKKEPTDMEWWTPTLYRSRRRADRVAKRYAKRRLRETREQEEGFRRV